MTTAQDKKDDAAQVKKDKRDAASVGTLSVGDSVKAGGKDGTITEALKSPDGQIRNYRVEVKAEKGDKTEIVTVAASTVELRPEDADKETPAFEAGDAVIARGGERGSVTEVVTTDTDPRLSTYRVQFGGTLGLVKIRGEELSRRHIGD